ncbi:MAG: rhomboid family intramembrane serine protease [Pirellulaceae bacterium]|nr:rhomboid family intramembrane serine protease [Pirellulaceae bacterium]
MFPLHDNIRSRTFPWVTYTLIGLCSIAFLIQFLAGPQGDRIVEQWGMVPARVIANEAQESAFSVERPRIVETNLGPREVLEVRPLLSAGVSDWLTLLTCMFLHGGLMHFAGNMWFLHIFGDNVEDRLGHFLYATLYIGAGLIAGLTHLFSNPASLVPTIGASGAIAGVMGAYILLYPKSMVETIVPIPGIFYTIAVPAPIFLGIWFLMQLYQGASSDASSGGVAWWAHVGGFVAGFAAAGFLVMTHVASPPVEADRVSSWGKPPTGGF